MKTKITRCAVCENLFVQYRSFVTWCSADCGLIVVKKKIAAKAKVERRDDSVRRIAIKTRAQWLKEAQTAFNSYIRARDSDLPCISCGRHHKGQYHAGHFLSVGARPDLRFVESNVHKQCSACNTHLSGNIVLYRKALIEKVGLMMVEWLEGPHKPCHYDIEQLKAIKKSYAAMARNFRGKE